MACYSVSLQTKPRILPMAVRMGNVEIFVCQVKASGVAYLVVNDRNFPVIPVVHEDVQKGYQGIKDTALDTLLV